MPSRTRNQEPKTKGLIHLEDFLIKKRQDFGSSMVEMRQVINFFLVYFFLQEQKVGLIQPHWGHPSHNSVTPQALKKLLHFVLSGSMVGFRMVSWCGRGNEIVPITELHGSNKDGALACGLKKSEEARRKFFNVVPATIYTVLVQVSWTSCLIRIGCCAVRFRKANMHSVCYVFVTWTTSFKTW